MTKAEKIFWATYNHCSFMKTDEVKYHNILITTHKYNEDWPICNRTLNNVQKLIDREKARHQRLEKLNNWHKQNADEAYKILGAVQKRLDNHRAFLKHQK